MKSVGYILFFSTLMVLISSCGNTSLAQETPVTTVSYPTLFPMLDTEEVWLSGNGNSLIEVDDKYLPFGLSFTSEGNGRTTYFLVFEWANEIETVQVLNSLQELETSVSFDGFDRDSKSLLFSILEKANWSIQISRLGDFSILEVPGRLRAKGNYYIALKGAEPHFIVATREDTSGIFAVRALTKNAIVNLIATNKSIHEEIIQIEPETLILEISSPDQWAIEVVDRRDLLE
ncbi:MAG: hypothetical protein PVF85_00375 [Anaerolineales bacterium]